MDPDANLEEQLRITKRVLDADGCDADDIIRLAELVDALDGWIVKGGFLPKRWTNGQKRS